MQKQSAKTFDGNTGQPQSDAEFWPLSGKPYFHVVIGKKKYFQMVIYNSRLMLIVCMLAN